MKRIITRILILPFLAVTHGLSQTNPVIDAFPQGTVLHSNVPYRDDNQPKHLLDIYLPANAREKIPLVILVHGGGWLSNDKYADIGYMKKTVAAIVSRGFALASIDYRFSTQAIFLGLSRYIRTRRPHLLAHPPSWPSPDCDGGRGPCAALGRLRGRNPAGRRSLDPARSEALARSVAR